MKTIIKGDSMKELLPYEKQINALDKGEAILADKEQPVTVEDAIKEIGVLNLSIKEAEEITERYVDTEFACRLNSLISNLNKRKEGILKARLSKINNY